MTHPPAICDKKFEMPAWVHQTNVYEVNLRQYSAEGSFLAFEKALPRLKDMGVHTLWFMPVTPISMVNRKGAMGSYYACSDYTSVNPEFGTLEEFRGLISIAHAAGFKVIIDWVANHTGWDHRWTKEHPDYYKQDETGNFCMASGMEDIIELDFTNPELRKAMIAAMEFWIRECDIDGFRCDLAFWVDLEFWKEARTHLEKIKQLFWLAETDPLEKPAYMEVFDALYTWSWMHKTADYYKQPFPFSTLKNVLYNYADVCGNHSIPLWFTSNHDENSWNGTEYEKYGEMALPLAVFSILFNGIPLIYSGQEVPNLKRLEFFDKDCIEWQDEMQLHEFYSCLLSLRWRNPALRAADRDVKTHVLDTGYEQPVLSFIRESGKSAVMLLLNFSGIQQNVILIHPLLHASYKNVFDNSINEYAGSGSFTLPAWGYLIFEKINP